MLPNLAYVSLDTLVFRVRKRIEDNPAFVTNEVGSATAGQTTLVVTAGHGANFIQGDVVSWDDSTYEDAYVQSVSTDTLTIVRGWNGTSPSSHSNGAVVLKDPRFRPQQVQNSVQRIVNELWPDGWQVKNFLITPVQSTWYYAVSATDFIDVVSIVQKRTSSVPQTDYAYYGAKRSKLPWSVVSLPTADFANNTAINLPYHDNDTNAITVFYRAFVDTTVVEDGIMADTVEAGAVWFLTAAKDITRTALNTSQADQTIPPNTLVKDAAFWLDRYQYLRKKLKTSLIDRGLGPALAWE